MEKNVQLRKLINDQIVDIMPKTVAENVTIGSNDLSDLIPDEASSSNQLADKAYVDGKTVDITAMTVLNINNIIVNTTYTADDEDPTVYNFLNEAIVKRNPLTHLENNNTFYKLYYLTNTNRAYFISNASATNTGFLGSSAMYLDYTILNNNITITAKASTTIGSSRVASNSSLGFVKPDDETIKVDTNGTLSMNIWRGTKAEYLALGDYDNDKIYFIKG